jgi:hypothetical protein
MTERADPLLAAIRARRRTLAAVNRRRYARVQDDLARSQAHQRDVWAERAAALGEVHGRLEPHREPRFVQGSWDRFETEIASFLLPSAPFDFQRSTTLRDTMVMVTGGRAFRTELETCRRVWDDTELASLAEEDLAGDPVLHADDPPTSHTRIHHLHTLARHRLARGPGPESASVTIEWGGGFGGLARVLRRLGPPDSTIVLIDLPLLTSLQWAYLGTTLGADDVHLVDNGGHIERGRVNLVPNGLLDRIDVEPDTFISTWALGESEPAAQDEVRERGWFDAANLIIADQRTRAGGANSDRVLDLAESHGAVLEPVGTVPGSFFAFR